MERLDERRQVGPHQHVGVEQDANTFAFERDDGGKKVLVVINTSETKTSETSASATGGAQMMTSFTPGTQLVDVLSNDPAANVTVGTAGALTVSVPMRGAKILVPASDVIPLP